MIKWFALKLHRISSQVKTSHTSDLCFYSSTSTACYKTIKTNYVECVIEINHFHFCEWCDVCLWSLTPVDNCHNTRQIVPSAHHNQSTNWYSLESDFFAHNEFEKFESKRSTGTAVPFVERIKMENKSRKSEIEQIFFATIGRKLNRK